MLRVFMGKRGPTAFSPDWNQVDSLCGIQCTGEEIASFFGVEYKTLERACKRENDIKLGEYIRQKSLVGKVSLRRKQWKSADSGSVPMQIWLGKNILGQKDKSDDEIEAMKGKENLSDSISKLIDKLPS